MKKVYAIIISMVTLLLVFFTTQIYSYDRVPGEDDVITEEEDDTNEDPYGGGGSLSSGYKQTMVLVSLVPEDSDDIFSFPIMAQIMCCMKYNNESCNFDDEDMPFVCNRERVKQYRNK